MNFKKLSTQELEKLHRELHRDITNIYPVGVEKSDPAYSKYEGIKSLFSLIDFNIADASRYSSVWEGKVCGEIASKTGKKVVGATYGYVPSLSSYIPLDKNPQNEVYLYFYVSLAAKYFSIEIITFDRFKKVNEAEKFYVPGVINVTVSPAGIYSDLFLTVEKTLRQQFTDYKFLPAAFDFLNLEGLNVIQNDHEDNSVSNAFFSKVVRDSDSLIAGDITYGDISS